MNDKRRSTQPPIYVCNSLTDNEIHKEFSSSWYESFCGIMCGRLRKKCNMGRNKLYVKEASPPLVLPVQVCYSIRKEIVQTIEQVVYSVGNMNSYYTMYVSLTVKGKLSYGCRSSNCWICESPHRYPFSKKRLSTINGINLFYDLIITI